MDDQPPFDQRDGQIWFNGNLVPWREAGIHILNHSMHYGSSVFEGERAYDGRIFRLNEHSKRLVKSAQLLDYEIPYRVEDIDAACRQVLAAQGLKDAYIRPVAWRGSETMRLSAQETSIHLAIAAWEWPSYFDMEQRLRGIRLHIAKWRRPDPATAPTESKAACLYVISTLAKHDAERNGYDDALMLDWRGRVAESTGSNIFFVRAEVLYTPVPDCFLDGITRHSVIDLARARGLTVVEQVIMPEEMGTMEQCFVCGTAAEITPVAQIGPYRFTPGAITRHIMEDYSACVRSAS